jgi:protein-tyrosine phosphatase
MNVVEHARRVVRLGGVRNLRDLGGYPTHDGRSTRWRTLFRSDCLHQLDLEGQAWLVDDLGLRTIIDLRGDDEIARDPNVLATHAAVAYRHMPMFDGPPAEEFVPDLRRGYLNDVARAGASMAAVVGVLAEPGALPALIHCHAGKDRTGLMVAVVLGAVGVLESVIAEDYAYSSVCLGPDYLVEARQLAERQGQDWAIWEHVAHTPPERMLLTLEHLRAEYGGVPRYLLAHGATADSLARLREVLTESEPSSS